VILDLIPHAGAMPVSYPYHTADDCDKLARPLHESTVPYIMEES
jgi:hypothetical protein